MANLSNIVKNISLNFNATGITDAISKITALGSSASTLLQDVAAGAAKARDAANSLGTAYGAQAVNFQNAMTAFMNYNKVVIESSTAYMRAGGSVKEYQAQIEKLRQNFHLTTDQATKLAQSTSAMFVGMNVKEMNTQMDALLKTFRNNADAVQAFQNSMKGLRLESTLMQKAITSGDYGSLVRLADLSGNEGAAAGARQARDFAGASPGDKAALDKLNEPLDRQRKVITQFEKANIEYGASIDKVIGPLTSMAGASARAAAALDMLAVSSTVASVASMIPGLGGKGMKGTGQLLSAAGRMFKSRGLRKAGVALTRGGGKFAAEAATKVAGKAATKTLAKTGAKALGKAALKKIPLIGAGAGLLFAAQRAMSGDFTGAAMEAASGAASIIPGLGTAASIGIDAALAAKDIHNASKEADALANNAGNAAAEVGGVAKAAEEVEKQTEQAEDSWDRIKRALDDANIKYERTNNLLSSQTSLQNEQYDVLTKSGNAAAATAMINDRQANIEKTRAANAERIKTIQAQIADIEANTKDPAMRQALLETAQTNLNKAVQEEYNLNKQILESAKKRTEVYDNQIALERKRTDTKLQEMKLVESMGMGLGPSVAMRQQAANSLMQQVDLHKEALGLIEKEMEAERAKANDANASEEDRQKAQARLNDLERDYEDRRQKILSTTQEAAELTKKMREGYISSIPFMQNMAGSFTKIVISQEQNLKTLAKSRQDSIETLTKGGFGGSTKSAGFGPSGFYAGDEAPGAEKALKSMGIETTFEDVRKAAQSVTNLMENAARSGVGPAAGFSSTVGAIGSIPTGPGATIITAPGVGGSTSGATPISINNSGSVITSSVGGGVGGLTDSTKSELVNAIVKNIIEVINASKTVILEQIKKELNV